MRNVPPFYEGKEIMLVVVGCSVLFKSICSAFSGTFFL